ncbi:MAG: hypothetical protein ABGZ53_09865 [Fuerstiella sp.]
MRSALPSCVNGTDPHQPSDEKDVEEEPKEHNTKKQKKDVSTGIEQTKNNKTV